MINFAKRFTIVRLSDSCHHVIAFPGALFSLLSRK